MHLDFASFCASHPRRVPRKRANCLKDGAREATFEGRYVLPAPLHSAPGPTYRVVIRFVRVVCQIRRLPWKSVTVLLDWSFFVKSDGYFGSSVTVHLEWLGRSNSKTRAKARWDDLASGYGSCALGHRGSTRSQIRGLRQNLGCRWASRHPDPI